MFQKMMLALTGLVVFAVVPAFAATDCRKSDVVGSYTRPLLNVDVIGDGTVIHSWVYQLTLNRDGTANQYVTAFPDYMISFGTGSPWIGSWFCRNDGKLVLTVINASYTPITFNNINDVTLAWTSRITYLFSVVDDTTLMRIQARERRYAVTEDPTDPTAGTLRTLNTDTFTYKKLKASDADLLAP